MKKGGVKEHKPYWDKQKTDGVLLSAWVKIKRVRESEK